MTITLEGQALIALANLMATIWIERDIEGQFVMVNASDAWEATSGTKRFRCRDALRELARQERWDDIRELLDASIARARSGLAQQRGSTGLTEGDAFNQLTQALQRQGLDVGEGGELVAASLGEIAAKEEIGHFEALLRRMGFDVCRNHFRQAMSALSREEWEGANGQTRAFFDALCEAVADRLWAESLTPAPTGGEARKYLESSGFVDTDEAQLLRSFFKVLHGGGSHPGTSDRDDARRRILMASSMGSYYIERLMAKEEKENRDRYWIKALGDEVLEGIGFMTQMAEYQSVDFDIATIADETVVFEVAESGYGAEHPISGVWLEELESAMERGYVDFAIVLTDRGVDAATSHLSAVSEAVFLRRSRIAIVRVQRDEPEASKASIALARDALSDAIASKREADKNKPDLMKLLRELSAKSDAASEADVIPNVDEVRGVSQGRGP